MKIFNTQILIAFQKKFSKQAKTMPAKIELTNSMCVFYWPNGRITKKNIALTRCDIMETRIVFDLCYKNRKLRLVVLNVPSSIL